MKNTLIILCSIIMGVSFGQVSSEDLGSQPNGITSASQNNDNRVNQLFINQIERNPIGANRQLNDVTNTVIIQQIGNGNTAQSNRNSQTSTINYTQFGNNNVINSVSLIPNTTENLFQIGNNNNITNFSFGTVENSTLRVLQNGNNQNFEKFGTNSITESLTLRITGDNSSVIIRSFN